MHLQQHSEMATSCFGSSAGNVNVGTPHLPCSELEVSGNTILGAVVNRWYRQKDATPKQKNLQQSGRLPNKQIHYSIEGMWQHSHALCCQPSMSFDSRRTQRWRHVGSGPNRGPWLQWVSTQLRWKQGCCLQQRPS